MYYIVLILVFTLCNLLKVKEIGYITLISGVILHFLTSTLPSFILLRSLKGLDFNKNEISFVKFDRVKIHSFLLHKIVKKIRYLEYIILNNIDSINDERDKSERDKLTGCYNRVKLDRMKLEYEKCDSVFIIFIDVNNLKKMNDIYGHEAGDALLRSATKKLKFWKEYGELYRLGGDEFLVVIKNKREDSCRKLLDKWYPTVGNLNRRTDDFRCMLALGYIYSDSAVRDISELYKEADERMYEHKKEIKFKYGEELR